MNYLNLLKEAYDSNKVYYADIFKKINHEGYYQSNAYMDIVIPSSGRELYLVSTLNYLCRSINLCNKKINVVVEDFDGSDLVKSCVDQLKDSANLIYLNCYSIKNMFSRALAMNIPVYYFKSDSQYIMFHDSDLLVDELFFERTVDNLKNTKTWLQPFSGKRVSNLNQEDSERILNGDYLELPELTVSYPQSGAPGGSTIVPNELFRRVGGFDPELFTGYAPEDSYFWTKLESLFSKFDQISNCHVGNAHYSQNTTVYHLKHPQAYLSPFSVDYNRMLWRLTHNERQDLIVYKNKIYDKTF